MHLYIYIYVCARFFHSYIKKLYADGDDDDGSEIKIEK